MRSAAVCSTANTATHGAELPFVFDRFRRAANVAGHVPGAGMGLASAQQIVALHGGTISVESMDERGSTFTVRLQQRHSDEPGM